MKVLVASCEPVTRVLVESGARDSGYEVVGCRSGKAALEALQAADAPTIAVLDGALPGKDALAVCRDLRAAWPVGGPYLVVVTTGDADDATAAKAAGADAVLARPLVYAAVAACLENAGAALARSAPSADTAQLARPAVADALVGKTIDDKYEIVSLLGRGGMGAVYRARHVFVDEVVAFKIIDAAHAARPGFRERFVNEAKTMLRVVHPNVIAVRDCGVSRDGVLFLTMDLSTGQSLGDHLRAHGRVTEARVIKIGRQIASALAAAHDGGVVHRDLKPDNVLLECDDRARVCDFGLAKLRHDDGESPEITSAGAVVGTPYYMAPEQAAGEEVDGRADLYALGCILYEMLCGTRVFEGRSVSRLLRAHLTEPPVPPAQRGVAVAPRLEALVLRLLSKEPEERPATAKAVVEALDALAARPAPARRLKVLVADDSGVNRTLISGMLERWGHRAILAKDGAEAVAIATGPEAPFDVVLLDGEMPRCDGPEAARRIRAAEAGLGRRTPIVALAANAGPDRDRCLAAGMDVGISKPIRPDELQAALRRVAPDSSATSLPRGETGVFDRRSALGRVEGDEDLLRETLGFLVNDLERIVGEMREGAGRGDVERVARAAHELKGAAGNCGATALAAVADRLEQTAKASPPRDALLAVEREVERECERSGPILRRAARAEEKLSV
jgi:CheY-like chemotaxis protein/HPt (histidine-containing phosphotransfer) domain-containing protein